MKCKMRNEDLQEEELPHQGCEEELPSCSDTKWNNCTITWTTPNSQDHMKAHNAQLINSQSNLAM